MPLNETLCISIEPSLSSASIEQPQLEALPASASEVLVSGDRQMAAFATGESPVPSGCHCLKLIA
jgi:hypothetical protein